MASQTSDDDTFTGRRLQRRHRKPLDLSLGYYVNAPDNDPITSSHSHKTSIKDQHRHGLSATNSNHDNQPHLGMALESTMKENEMIVSRASETSSSDPITVDHFLRVTAAQKNSHATRNYKQTRKRRRDQKRFVEEPDDALDVFLSPAQNPMTSKALKTATTSKSRTHHRAAHVLSVSGVRFGSALSSPPILHPRLQPIKNAKASSVGHEVDGSGLGIATLFATKAKPAIKRTVQFLPSDWTKHRSRPGRPTKASAPRNPGRAQLTVGTTRAALNFESIEEHDNKLALWLEDSTHGMRRGAQGQVPCYWKGLKAYSLLGRPLLGGDVPRLPSYEFAVAKHVNKGSSKLGTNAHVVNPSDQTLEVNDGLDTADAHGSTGQPTEHALLAGKKMTHLGDMLGVLRLSAKGLHGQPENGPAAG